MGTAHGFTRKGTTLHRDQSESIFVLNLQGSRYGGRYYLNVAIWLKSLGDEAFPSEVSCHLRTRLSELSGVDAEPFLDMGSDLSDEERREQFRAALDGAVGPVLSQTETLAALRRNSALRSRFLVDKDALPLFDG